jgi:hypothetical protein
MAILGLLVTNEAIFYNEFDGNPFGIRYKERFRYNKRFVWGNEDFSG